MGNRVNSTVSRDRPARSTATAPATSSSRSHAPRIDRESVSVDAARTRCGRHRRPEFGSSGIEVSTAGLCARSRCKPTRAFRGANPARPVCSLAGSSASATVGSSVMQRSLRSLFWQRRSRRRRNRVRQETLGVSSIGVYCDRLQVLRSITFSSQPNTPT